ncbi:MAG: hypothetical protein C0483_17130 [Pirellula sp.]|nr:hypothetical protein [Pirellula sp.]
MKPFDSAAAVPLASPLVEHTGTHMTSVDCNPCRRSSPTSRYRSGLIVVIVLLLGSGNADAASLPKYDEVREIVETHFAAKPGYKDGDLVSKGDVEPILKQLAARGFDVRRKEQGAEMLLADGHPLVKLFRTPAGLQFMRKVKDIPDVYDRFARLSSFAAGHAIVVKIINTKNVAAATLLCSPAAAREIEEMFPNEQACINFEVSAGRTYTVEQYLDHLRSMLLLTERNLSRPGD